MGQESDNEIIWTGVIMRLLTAILSTVSVIALVYIVDGGDPLIVKIAILESIGILASAFDTFMYWFQGKLLGKYVSIASVAAYLGMSLFRLYLLINGADVMWFAFATSVDTLILSIVLMACYIAKNGMHIRASIRIAGKLMKQSYHYMISGLIAILYSRIDQVMLGKMLNSYNVGLYSAALSIAGLWSMIPSAFIQSVSPVLYKNATEDRAMYLKRLKQSYAGMWLLNIAWSLGISLFSYWVIYLLYGADYLGARWALVIVVWYTGIASIGSLTQVYLATENKNKYINYYAVAGLIADVILNALLIPQLGIIGAAIATLATYVVINILMPYVIPDTREAGRLILEGMIFKDVVDDDMKKLAQSTIGKIKGRFNK
jgi:O-antigen/teichoic acid export membrane protein